MTLDESIADILRGYPQVLKTDQVCQVLRIHRKTLYKLIQSGDIPAIKIGKGYKVTREKVRDYWERMDRKGNGDDETENL